MPKCPMVPHATGESKVFAMCCLSCGTINLGVASECVCGDSSHTFPLWADISFMTAHKERWG